ncbi:PREDICTED: prostaglandin E2 receptor EP2 subtype [Myotis davidii]|uniref:prostaglandin E2 receptor EP2 subtype n=1 Tax=Myotis davidii TaxID=225400 RepID=UPI000767C88F|nr:PREDICTED: prostaglandin E2 receptor EP2 subtype [Myotis davidii]
MKPSFLRCQNTTSVERGYSAAMGWVLFSAGLLGNLLALGLLARSGLSSCSLRSPRPPPSVFYVLVCGLTVTDLLGKSLLSPFVLAAYAQNRSLWGLVPPPGSSLCQAFAFFMSFFGLASTLQLLAMALECWLSLGHPFFYRRHITLRRGALVAPAVGAFCLAFCALPFAGFGKFVQYCPGTWCFIRHGRTVYLQLYATLLLLLILAVLACNFSVMLNLIRMHRRGRRGRCGPTLGSGRGPATRRRGERVSVAEETDHLILLAIMTITFAVCSLPFTIFAYMNETSSRKEKWDLQALRFLSANPIINPWVFAILRPPVLRLMRSVLCCRASLRTQDTTETSCSTRSTASKHTDLCGQ